MQRVANRPIVCHVLDSLASAQIDELAVVAPSDATSELRQCIDADDSVHGRLTYLPYDRDDLLGALEAALPFVSDDPVLVHLADGLVGQGLDPFVEPLGTDRPDALLLLHRSSNTGAPLGTATQRLLGITELKGQKSRLDLADVCVFGPDALRRACGSVNGDGHSLELAGIAERLASTGSILQAGFVRTWRRYRGQPLDLLELNRIVLDRQAPDDEVFEGDDNRIEGRVVIHRTAHVQSSVVVGPAIIGPEARISSSYIGPYTSIGAGAQIESAEIERSIIAEGARIMHIGSRIQASTVGPGASIFRDFGLPRAMRLHVGEGVELALNGP